MTTQDGDGFSTQKDVGPDENVDGGRLTQDQEIAHYIDMWKQCIAMQMHFNDIEWRIRGLALTVVTFALGAAGVAAKDGTQVGWVSLGTLVILIGLLLWYVFYFVDRHWYHPLLKAAVKHGTQIEGKIKETLPEAGVTAAITEGSRYEPGRFVRILSRQSIMHSDHKLVWFYRVGALALVLAAIAFQVGAALGVDVEPADSKPDVNVVVNVPAHSSGGAKKSP